MNHAITGIACRAAQAEFSPSIKIDDQIDDPTAELAVNRAGTIAAVFLKRSWRKSKMHSRIGRSQISGYDRRWSDIHRIVPLRLGHSGGLPLVVANLGEAGQPRGSDNFMGSEIVTPVQPGICRSQRIFGGTKCGKHLFQKCSNRNGWRSDVYGCRRICVKPATRSKKMDFLQAPGLPFANHETSEAYRSRIGHAGLCRGRGNGIQHVSRRFCFAHMMPKK